MWSYAKFVFWVLIWIPVWCVTVPFRGNKDNCANYAVTKWDKEGGYLVIRWCRSNKVKWVQWPHFLWLDAKYHRRLEHIIPKDQKHMDKHTIPSPWFEPRVVHGDPHNDKRGEN